MDHNSEIEQQSSSDDEAAGHTVEKHVPKRKQKSEAAISGQVATYTLLFLFLFVGFLVWISG